MAVRGACVGVRQVKHRLTGFIWVTTRSTSCTYFCIKLRQTDGRHRLRGSVGSGMGRGGTSVIDIIYPYILFTQGKSKVSYNYLRLLYHYKNYAAKGGSYPWPILPPYMALTAVSAAAWLVNVTSPAVSLLHRRTANVGTSTGHQSSCTGRLGMQEATPGGARKQSRCRKATIRGAPSREAAQSAAYVHRH